MSRHIRDELQRRIVSGVWAPGERLQLSALSEEFRESKAENDGLRRSVGVL